MPFHYQKRIRLGKGAGLNLSKRGVSASYRSKHGSIGTRGFSLRTGIPGLTFRSSWAKSKEGLAILLALGLFYLGVLILYNLILGIIYLSRSLYDYFQSR